MQPRTVWIALGLATFVIVGLFVAMNGSPIRTQAAIESASLLDDTRLELYLGCGSGVVWNVDESPLRVVADVRMFHRPGDCSAGAILELSEPLGDRPLIDGATGDEIGVAYR